MELSLGRVRCFSLRGAKAEFGAVDPAGLVRSQHCQRLRQLVAQNNVIILASQTVYTCTAGKGRVLSRHLQLLWLCIAAHCNSVSVQPSSVSVLC